jgi:hypothetical protein
MMVVESEMILKDRYNNVKISGQNEKKKPLFVDIHSKYAIYTQKGQKETMCVLTLTS